MRLPRATPPPALLTPPPPAARPALAPTHRLAGRAASLTLHATTTNTIRPPGLARGPGNNNNHKHAGPHDPDTATRAGGGEAAWVRRQAAKPDPTQPPLATLLPPLPPGAGASPATPLDAVVVGAGPAGLALAGELGRRGLRVALVGRDEPFVNTYGVWVDELEALGLGGAIADAWPAAACHFGDGPGGTSVSVPRAYGRVDRGALRAALAARAAAAGVVYGAGEVSEAGGLDGGGRSLGLTLAPSASAAASASASASPPPPPPPPRRLHARLVTLASGAAAGGALAYEAGAPPVAAQTAYGIEAEVEGWGGEAGGAAAGAAATAAASSSSASAAPAAAAEMVFMDFRRHHTGVWEGAAGRLAGPEGAHHPAGGGGGLWGTGGEAPSFLYAMPGPGPGPGTRVFLEETCLVSRPPLPFAVLQRRLHRRLAAAGVKVVKVHDEEWSYIPVGGPLPIPNPARPLTAFGAAAGLVHPATGYSLARSLAEAPAFADAAAAALAVPGAGAPAVCAAVWGALWPASRRRAAAFQLFGMELLARLGPADTDAFFRTFFALPAPLWRGFLGSTLSPAALVGFAAATFIAAPWRLRVALVRHLLTDPSGRYLMRAYATGAGGREA